jgi:hypothetical protein
LLLLLVNSALWAQSKMTKHDLAADGLSIVLPDEPNFAGELKAIGFSSPSTPKDVIVKNTSGRDIAAFGVRYVYQFEDGDSAPFSNIVELLPEALSDAGAPGKRVSQPLIEAGGALLLSPDGIVQHTPSQVQVIGRVYPAKKVVGTSVEVNAVVFADGEVHGPDNMQIAEQLRLQLEEQQNLLKEVSRRVAAGEQMGDILNELTRIPRNKRTITNRTGIANRRQIAKRTNYLRRVIYTYHWQGEANARNELKRLSFVTMPNIHREGEN